MPLTIARAETPEDLAQVCMEMIPFRDAPQESHLA